MTRRFVMKFVLQLCVFEAKAKKATPAQYYLGDGLYWGLYRLEEDEPRANLN